MKKRLRNQKGFTLIEIIAVLIILGILAAVAVPKFLDLTENAEKEAIEGALAAGLSTCSMQFARLALSNGVAPSENDVRDACLSNPPGSDDFNYAFTAGSGSIDVVASWKSGSTATASATWEMPD